MNNLTKKFQLINNPYKINIINKIVAVNYIKIHHYSKTCSPNPYPCFGLFEQNILIGVLAFAVPCSENVCSSFFGKKYKRNILELHRLHILDITPKNVESWVISQCLKLLKQIQPNIMGVVSFADSSEGHNGTIYKATNAYYLGKTNPAIFYRDQEGRLRHPRQKTHINGNRVTFNLSKQEAKKRGWIPEKRLGKHRYFYLTPDNKQHKKELIKICLYDLIQGKKKEKKRYIKKIK